MNIGQEIICEQGEMHKGYPMNWRIYFGSLIFILQIFPAMSRPMQRSKALVNFWLGDHQTNDHNCLWWLKMNTERAVNVLIHSHTYLWTALYRDGHGGLGLRQGHTDGNSRSQRLDSRGRSLYRDHLLLTRHCKSTATVGSYWHLKCFSQLSFLFALQPCVMYVCVIRHLLSIVIIV